MMNPIADVLTQARRAVVDPHAPSAAYVIGGATWLAIPVGFVVLLFGLGFWLFNRDSDAATERKNCHGWTRLTSGTDPDSFPTWTPDGEFLAFRSGNTLAWTRSDGGGKVDRLAGVSRDAGPWSFSADGTWLAFWPLQPGSDLWAAASRATF